MKGCIECVGAGKEGIILGCWNTLFSLLCVISPTQPTLRGCLSDDSVDWLNSYTLTHILKSHILKSCSFHDSCMGLFLMPEGSLLMVFCKTSGSRYTVTLVELLGRVWNSDDTISHNSCCGTCTFWFQMWWVSNYKYKILQNSNSLSTQLKVGLQ